MGGAIGVWSHGLAPEAHSVSTQKMCDSHVPGWTTQGRERERDGEGELTHSSLSRWGRELSTHNLEVECKVARRESRQHP